MKRKKNNFQIYLDYAASTPLNPSVFKIMKPFFLKNYGNPNSLHQLGQINFNTLNKARKFIAEKLNCNFDEIIFTGSATEANNLFIQGAIEQFKKFFYKLNLKYQPKIITSSIEHESVLEIFKKYEKEDFEVIYLPVNKKGEVNLKKLKETLDEKTILISIMSANNEIGTIQNIKKINEIIKEFKKEKIKNNLKDSYPLFHSDAVQYYQYFKIDLKEIDLHGLTLSAHKIYGPKGIGLLYLKKIKNFIFDKIEILNFQPIKPLILGGGQEFNFRSGTQNIPYIIGFQKSIELIEKNREKNYKKIIKLRKWFLENLKKIDKRIKINGFEGSPNKNLPNILNIYLPKYNSQEWLIKFDLKGICVSTGSACLSRISQPSYVLKALKLKPHIINQSLRFSFGQYTNIKELKYVLKTIKEFLN